MEIFLLAAAILIGVILYRKYRTFSDIIVNAPATKRTDLYYGYFSCLDNQVAETKDHVNIFMDSQFDGPDKCIQNILDAQMDTILDIQYQLFEKSANILVIRPNAEQILTDFLNLLKLKGALKFVKIIYVADEANNTTTLEMLSESLKITKTVVAKFSELADIKYGMIYAADKPFIGQELFDYIGFDDYDKKSTVLVNQYEILKKSLLPGQKTILVPGGAYGQDPMPFVNFAEANSEVGILMPFLWFDDKNGSVGALGIRSNANKQSYIDAGKFITGKWLWRFISDSFIFYKFSGNISIISSVHTSYFSG